MAVNSYKDDEQSVERSKVQTLLRLFRYLLDYRWQIILVLLIMGYGVAVSLVNPLIIFRSRIWTAFTVCWPWPLSSTCFWW